MDPILPPFNVTRSAIDKISDLGGAVRVALEPGGCCGTTYRFVAPADPSDPGVGPASDGGTGYGSSGDHVHYGCDGAWLLVRREDLDVLRGCTLDYSDRVKPPRYRIIGNPNTPLRCPCNRSFGTDWPGRGHPDCQAKAPMPWDREQS